MSVQYLYGSNHANLAYVHSPASGAGEAMPSVMFLGGFCSDMTGTKACYLEQRCIGRGQGYVRFDYSGHGESDGVFAEGTIGRWMADAMDILDQILSGPVILVGSSMGGWIALQLLLQRAERVAGVVGIASAPDFTKDIEVEMTSLQRQTLEREGSFEIESEYGYEPYVFTKDLIEDGRVQSVLDGLHPIDVPLTLLQGKQDTSVPWKKALAIEKAFPGPATKVIFIEDGDHRLSHEKDLALIDREIVALSGT